MTVIVIWLDVEKFFSSSLFELLCKHCNNHRQWSWDDNKDYAFALTSKSGLICCKCFDVLPTTTGCIHVPHFSARKHAPALRVQPTWPKWEVGCKKIPNFDEKSPKKPLREVTATPTPISGAYSPEPMIQQEQLDRCYVRFAKRLHPGRPVLGVSLVDQCLGSPW